MNDKEFLQEVHNRLWSAVGGSPELLARLKAFIDAMPDDDETWIVSSEKTPESGVEVQVLTEAGVEGVARYWSMTGKWLGNDRRIKHGDSVVAWRKK